jgi:hydrogenase small subunit
MANVLGTVVRTLRAYTERTLEDEPKWRTRGKVLKTGYQPRW